MFAALKTRLPLWLALAALFTVALPAMSAPVKYFFTGYVQGRFSETFGEVGVGSAAVEVPDTFEIRRAYIMLKATVDEHIGATVLVNAFNTNRLPTGEVVGNDLNLLEAYGEYTAKPFSGRLGLSRIPFGYEVPLSSASLITLERSLILQDLVFPFAFDRGIFGYYQQPQGLGVALAVTNGRTVNAAIDNNDRKNVIGRISYALKNNGTIGLSRYQGDNPNTGATLDVNDLDIVYNFGPLLVLSELVNGQNGDLDPKVVT